MQGVLPPVVHTSKRQGEISDFDKGRIVGWHDEGVSKREIGHRLGRNESTIRNFFKRCVKSKSIYKMKLI